jgi:hypothetical protein
MPVNSPVSTAKMTAIPTAMIRRLLVVIGRS